MDMFRPEVTEAIEMHAALKTEGFVDVERTVKFMKRQQRWISLHDASGLKEHQWYRLPDKMRRTTIRWTSDYIFGNSTSIPSYTHGTKKFKI
jgi:hypothetical protein